MLYLLNSFRFYVPNASLTKQNHFRLKAKSKLRALLLTHILLSSSLASFSHLDMDLDIFTAQAHNTPFHFDTFSTSAARHATITTWVPHCPFTTLENSFFSENWLKKHTNKYKLCSVAVLHFLFSS